MTNPASASQPENCPMCGRGPHRPPSQDPPPVPCPLCSVMPELATMTESGKLTFVASILPELRVTSKEAALREIVGSLVAKQALTEHTGQSVLDAISNREQLTSTELGCGIAIAYARYAGIDYVLGAFARSEAGLDFGSRTGQPVNLVFLVVSPASQPAEHLHALQAIAKYLKAFDGNLDSVESQNDSHA